MSWQKRNLNSAISVLSDFFFGDDRGAPIGVSAVTGAIGTPRIFLRK